MRKATGINFSTCWEFAESGMEHLGEDFLEHDPEDAADSEMEYWEHDE